MKSPSSRPACLTGDYPIEIPDEAKAQKFALETEDRPEERDRRPRSLEEREPVLVG
jgi:hypothetical protein